MKHNQEFPDGWTDDPIVKVNAKITVTRKRGGRIEHVVNSLDGLKRTIAMIAKEPNSKSL